MRPRPLFASQEAREWLLIAASDLRIAQLALEDAPPLIGQCLYHAQQAVEKAVKAFLVQAEVDFPFTHDIRRLVELCNSTDPELAGALTPAVDLTQFATRFRYPGEDQPAVAEAAAWLDVARRAYGTVARRIEQQQADESCT